MNRTTRAGASTLAALALGLSLLLGLVACGGGQGSPVAQLEVEPHALDLAHATFEDMTLHWRMTAPLEGLVGTPRVFVHLLDDQGRLTRTFDHPMPGGWTVGDERADQVRLVQSALAPPLPPGSYRLSVGLYDADGHRWPLAVEGDRVDNGEYTVADVTVPPTPAQVPIVSFSPTWSPTLAGGDRQILAVRWLTGDGTILLDEVTDPGVLWLKIRIPEQTADGSHRVLLPDRPGSEMPSVHVEAPCSGFEASVSGEGSHDVDVPVTAADGSCAIRLRPNYAMVTDGVEQQTVLLETLAWQASDGVEATSGAGAAAASGASAK